MSPHADVALLDPFTAHSAEDPLRTIASLTPDQAADASASSSTAAVNRALSEDSITFLERSRQPHDGE